MLADANGELAKTLGLEFPSAGLGFIRCKRFSAVLQDRKVTALNIEPDGTGLTCSLSNNILSSL